MNSEKIPKSTGPKKYKGPTQEKDAVKKTRETFTVEIRRQQREDEFTKQRKIGGPEIGGVVTGNFGGQILGDQDIKALNDHINTCIARTYSDEEFMDLCNAVQTSDIFDLHFGVIGLRKLLARAENPPIQPIIDSGLVPKLIECISREEQPHLQLEATWCLTNIASGTSEQTRAIVDKDGIRLFVKLLYSKIPEISAQAIWAIGNIAGDNTEFRDKILDAGGIPGVIRVLQQSTKVKLIKNATWALSNLCRGKPSPDYDQVRLAVPEFARIVNTQESPEIISDALWALVYLTDGEEERSDDLIDTGIIARLIYLLREKNLNILVPTLRVLGNVVSGTEAQTQCIVESGALAAFVELLRHDKVVVLREVCWSLSNITAGNPSQVNAVISNYDLLFELFNLVETACEEIQREAIWVLANATNHGTAEHVQFLVQKNLLEHMSRLLDSSDSKTVAVCLEGIYYILKVGADLARDGEENEFMSDVMKHDIAIKVQDLQEHNDNDIFLKAQLIVETYFEVQKII